MLIRRNNLLAPFDGPAPAATRQIEAEGYAVLRAVFAPDELRELREEILEVYRRLPGDRRGGIPDAAQAEMYRYQMFDRSALSQRAIAQPRILEVLEPLLGGDCHMINCTAWRNPPGPALEPQAFYWHIDGGPHVPRSPSVEWPDAIPYPIFVVAAHIYLDDCGVDDGPTTVIPTSHRSGQPPPADRCTEAVIEYRGHRPVQHVVRAGDVGFFVSDVWHRRSLPTERSRGRFFLQANYGRRDIAPRLLPPAEACQAGEASRARAATARQRTLIGLHPPAFYDG